MKAQDEYTISRETLREITTYDGTAYWARAGEATERGIRWTVLEPHEIMPDGREPLVYRATWRELAEALIAVATGKAQVWDEIRDYAGEVLLGNEPADAPDTNDVIIQMALFGRVIYG
jgi:hypothetical protein